LVGIILRRITYLLGLFYFQGKKGFGMALFKLTLLGKRVTWSQRGTFGKLFYGKIW